MEKLTCCICEKEIDTYKEKYTNFGCDGEFIHLKCREEADRRIDRLASMSDQEFIDWFSP